MNKLEYWHDAKYLNFTDDNVPYIGKNSLLKTFADNQNSKDLIHETLLLANI